MLCHIRRASTQDPHPRATPYTRNERETRYQHRPLDPIPGGRCSIVVSIPACHAGDPPSIPGNGASCLAIVMSHPEGFYPSSQSAGYSVRWEREGKWIATSALGLPIPVGRCSIVVSKPGCHAGDPGSIPGNGASCLAIVMSHPEGFDPSSQSAGYSVRSEREGNWIATSALGLPIPGGRCSIVVSIPACHAGDPGSIPGNGASCLAIVMSHPEGFYPSSQSAVYSRLSRG